MTRFVPRVAPVRPAAADDLGFAVAGDALLVVAGDGPRRLPTLGELTRAGVEAVRRQHLGSLDGRACWSLELDGEAPPSGFALDGLRSLYHTLPEPEFAVAGRAAQIVAWDRDHGFCGRCGAATSALEAERARTCPDCGLTAYPRLSPAVIVAVERDRRLLLARATRSRGGYWSVLAGFVEPGESLEHAVAREVAEEVGVELRDVRYFGSQPWPFPHQLMIGFTAAHAAGELRPDPGEIDDAGWFAADALPPVTTSRLSIARALIDDFVARRARD